jgi:predicted short-subunit dehydrogenase-like oxidoreductase (DUF2520 family)
MRIVIIGTGNTATVLGKLFIQAGHTIVQVFGRNPDHALHLGDILNSTFTTDGTELQLEADLYLVAVSDKAISSITSWLRLPGKLVVHCAGSVDKEVLSPCSKNYGVLYPVQSLRKELDSIPRIPFLVDGNTEDTGALIYDFANSLSRDVQFANDYQRMITHIAAIMVSNFTNHLYVVAEDLCKKEKIRFGLLLPIIAEVAMRIKDHSPSMLQTGPAFRGDSNTILNHIALLEKFPRQQVIYQHLTNNIQDWYDKDG